MTNPATVVLTAIDKTLAEIDTVLDHAYVVALNEDATPLRNDGAHLALQGDSIYQTLQSTNAHRACAAINKKWHDGHRRSSTFQVLDGREWKKQRKQTLLTLQVTIENFKNA